MVRFLMWLILFGLVMFFIINGWYLRKDVKDAKSGMDNNAKNGGAD